MAYYVIPMMRAEVIENPTRMEHDCQKEIEQP